MIDKTPAPKEKRAPLPAFTPVPRRNARHDGWTPERQAGFIEALADTGSVRSAAHAVNMTPESAYQLRRHAEAREFNKAWKAALALGVQRLEDVAMERALYGVEVPVYHFGEVVGSRRVYNDSLLMFLLRNRATKRFQADSLHTPDAVTRGRMDKLKKQWHAEWTEERRIADEQASIEAIEGINRKLETMRQRDLAATPPEARAHYHAYQRAMGEDLVEYPEWEGDDDDWDDENSGDDDARSESHADEAETPAPPAPEPAPGGPRIFSLNGDRWNFLTHPNDGRCTPY